MNRSLNAIATVPRLSDGSIDSVPYRRSNIAYSTKSSLDKDSLENMRNGERDNQMKKFRYERRKNADELVKKILDLELFSKPKIPDQTVPNTFKNYMMYQDIWKPLFEFEVYSQLVNIRQEGAKSKLADT